MHCDICNSDIDKRGYARHCKGSKHLKALAAAKKAETKNPAGEEEIKQEISNPAGEESKDEELPAGEEEIEEIVSSDPKKPNKEKPKEYLELKIIDGRDTESKKSNLDGILEKLFTPENIAIAGQVIGEILAKKMNNQEVQKTPKYGFDKNGVAVEF